MFEAINVETETILFETENYYSVPYNFFFFFFENSLLAPLCLLFLPSWMDWIIEVK